MDTLKFLFLLLACIPVSNAQTLRHLDLSKAHKLLDDSRSVLIDENKHSSKDGYLPILNSHQTWISIASSGFEHPSSFQYTYAEDSILLQTNYYFERILSNKKDGEDSFVFGYFRENNGKIYEKLESNSEERIILDMSLIQGDSIDIDQDGFSTTLVAAMVDTIIYNDSISRKRIELRCAQNPDDYGSYYWVEGIGELYSGIYCVLDGGNSYLTCVLNEDGERIYSTVNNDVDCWLTTSVKDEDQASIFLYPNPADEMIFISGLSNQISRGFIYNTYGQKVYHFDTDQLDISKLAPGVYFIKLIDKSNRTFSAKFVKSN